ncbi:MAG: polysaccharide biosynthesis tyrosine autokinase [Proteobacteria bacterium]|nr:polysaccharide biosynthesis tyrosine autokinase [Pseudomonadota bacterium]
MQNYQEQERFREEDVEQEVNIREYFIILLKRKLIVLTLLVVIFLVTVIKTFSTTPIYTSDTDVLIERNNSSSALERQYYSYDPDFLETQSAIIKSAKVARRVVDSLKLSTTYRSFFLEAKKDTPSFFANIETGLKDFIEKLISPLKSEVNSETNQDGERSGLNAEPLSDEEKISSMVQGRLSVEPVKNTKIVRIAYSDKSPIIAKLVADAVAKAYMEEILDMKLTTSRYALQWMTSKAQDERKKLEASEMAMQNYMRANDLVTVENKLAISPQRLSEFSSQLSKAQTDRKVLEGVLKQIDAAGKNVFQLENIPIFAGNEVLKSLREAIFKSRQNISELSKKYGEKHPVMIKANGELGELINQQQAEINRVIATTRNSYELAKSQEKYLDEMLTSTKSELLNLNEKFIQYSIMKRDVDANRVVYESLTSSIKKEGVTEQSQSINVWVIKNAFLPGAPSKPNKKRNLALGLILGLAAGIGCAFLVEYLDNTIKSEKELESRYGLTVLGAVEKLKEKGKNIESYIVQKPLSPLAESYRLIRSGLLLSSADHPPRTMLVTSMGPGEGKTSTTINIARVLSQGGKKVLIIDCDLRRPRVHSVFAMQNDKGLSNYLTGNLSENIIHKVAGEEIFVITSGSIPPNPSDLVGSKKLRLLIEKMSENFDFVLIDSPPVQSVTDSLTLTQLVDGTVVVVKAGVTTYETMQSGLKKLKDVQCHFLGFVLNGLPPSHAKGAYYSGYTAYYAKDNVS